MPVGRTFARALAGAAGASLGLRLAARATRRVGPVQVTARLGLARHGGVVLRLPPLGTATLHTHRGPLKITALATDIDPDGAQQLVGTAGDESAERAITAQLERAKRQASDELRQLAVALGLRSAVAAVAGAGSLAALALRRPRDILGGAAAGAGILAASAAAAAVTARKDGWREPELDGLLTRAPLILGDLRSAPARVRTYRDQLADLVATGTSVYRAVATLPGPPPGDAIRLLHLSDIHLSPLAFPLTKVLVEEYEADAVVDTGDLVNWGTPAEQRFADQVAGLGVPYIFIKGNHDSAGVADAVARQSNAVVLDAASTPVEVAGLRFAGMADPRFTPDKTTGDDFAAEQVSDAAKAWAPTLAGKKIDVALVHDPAAAPHLAGTVPLVLAGHTHHRAVRRLGETLVVVQGSSGGAGLQGVQENPPTPISMSLLYIDRVSKRLGAVDEITVGGIGAVSLNVVRRSAADLVA